MSEPQLQGRELDRAIAEAINRPFYKATSPEYSKDLNAMHVVEVYIERRGLSDAYMRQLAQVAAIGQSMMSDLRWLVVHATAEQKARAALAVLSK